MKFVMVALSLLLQAAFISCKAQVPEKIYAKNRALRSNEYYLQQMELWRTVVNEDPGNADAWLNLYRASRNAYVVGEEENGIENKGQRRFTRLQGIIDEMESNIPGTFEFHYATWLNGNGDRTLFDHLQNANAIRPDEPEPLMDLAFYYELSGDNEKRDFYLTEYYSNSFYSPGLLTYAYNVLAGLREQSIVFTEGDKDTEAILLLQAARGIRKDVKLINVNMLLDKGYRDILFLELGLPDLGFDPLADEASLSRYRSVLIEHVSQNQNNRSVYVSVTVSDLYTSNSNAHLYLTGLVYLYSESTVDAVSLTLKNYQQVFHLDYLQVYLPNDISVGMMYRFNTNYYPSLALLYKYYITQGLPDKAQHYKNIAEHIRDKDGNMHVFSAWFEP